jgi:putative toxin-antitoxin system antitoxin component (TIGR02293 family)
MLAKETFEDSDKADRWLRTPKLALEGDRPLDRLHTDAEAQSVEKVLGRIAHGVYS